MTSGNLVDYIPLIGPAISANVKALQPPPDNSDQLGEYQGKYAAAVENWQKYVNEDIFKNTENLKDTFNVLNNYIEVVGLLVTEQLTEKISTNTRYGILMFALICLLVIKN
jgi:predicted Zn-dependent protease